MFTVNKACRPLVTLPIMLSSCLWLFSLKALLQGHKSVHEISHNVLKYYQVFNVAIDILLHP